MSFITGLVHQDSRDPGAAQARAMLDATAIRGNDDKGLWAADRVALATRSLRTLDLTPDGSQPALCTTAPFVAALDGYIANGAALKRELEEAGIKLRGHGDAELLAEGAGHFGLNRLLQKLEGAFTFALWDGNTQTLHLVRDRLGIKPLYVTRVNKTYAFASDPAAFKRLDGFTFSIDTDAAASYLAWGFAPAPGTLWRDVMSLPPGHRLMLQQGDEKMPAPEAWWNAATALEEIALRTENTREQPDRLNIALSKEALRLEAPFTLLDDGGAATTMLRATIDRETTSPAKTCTVTAPDGVLLQTAFDGLSLLSEPLSSPIAPAWWAACRRAAADTNVFLAAGSLVSPIRAGDDHTSLRKILESFPGFLHWMIPEKYRHLAESALDAHAAKTQQWKGFTDPIDRLLPRMDSSENFRLAYLDFVNGFCGQIAPGLDRIAGSFNAELRLPFADARILKHGFPSMPVRGADIATWLRGPLRPRVQDLLKAPLFERLGIKDMDTFVYAWQRFLEGDNTMTQGLWTLATLLAWTKAHG